MDRLAEIVRDFPRTYTVTETDAAGDEQTREEPRYGVTVIDLGGHPDEVVRVIRERAGRMSVLAPTAANVGIHVYSFGTPEAINRVASAVEDEDVGAYWRGFPVSPDIGIVSWSPSNPVQLVIADVPHDASSWHHLLEEGGTWYWVEAEEEEKKHGSTP
ncbi:hypothetical protein LCGC14_0841440 [marine sediment metagenome]|uniref:Uncharacterized protein n=1 Tax=marine sediment metagenome TaxID=412755 RepID=A0A0F9PY81_9ZZZZ